MTFQRWDRGDRARPAAPRSPATAPAPLSPTTAAGLTRLLAPALAALLLALLVGACGEGVPVGHGAPRVVAAEDVWGSIAAQLGGSRTRVRSIIVNPAADPHTYEPTADDARSLAAAGLVIENGVGYDGWVGRLLAANPTGGRAVINVGTLMRVPAGGNPHQWYDPQAVTRVARAITATLRRLDPRHAAAYTRLLERFETRDLATYRTWLATIRTRFAGTAVGASESIFVPLARALGLRLITPASFMKANSEGTETSAQDLQAISRQITSHAIAVWIYNAQNVTPEVNRLTALARREHLPTVAITEALSPASATFEAWQVGQLARLAHALAQGRRA